MKFSAQRDTLAYHLLSRPLLARMDFGGVPAKSVGQCAKKFYEDGKSEHPESEALRFYLAHQIIAAIRKRRRMHEPLPIDELALVEQSIRVGNEVFLRMMYYVAVICLRECRNIHDSDGIKAKAKGKDFAHAMHFVTSIPDDANKAMQVFLDKVPAKLTLLQMAEAMAFAFHKGHWPSSSFGGHKWGVIADTLAEVARGDLTPEMFCDVAFALAHNGGPIFNKGMFYHSYSHEFKIILDVQRGGQIPQYITMGGSLFVSPETEIMRDAAQLVFGDEFNGPVDWHQVLEAGAVCEAEIKKKAGVTMGVQAPSKHIKAQFAVLPGKIITVMDREGAAKIGKLTSKLKASK